MKELSHYINGEYVKGSSGRFGDVYNPATGEVQARVPLASEEEMRRRSAAWWGYQTTDIGGVHNG